MRQPTKSSLTRKLDKEVSRITRARGYCAKCRMSDYEHLETAHIFSRNLRSVRWDIELNVLCLCDKDHFWAHQNPVLFTEFVKEYLGSYKYTQLKLRARQIKQWKLDEMQDLLNELKKL